MKYRSLNGHEKLVDFKEAVLSSLAPDKGLYFPTEIPKLSKQVLENFKNLSKHELCFEAIKPFVGDCIPQDKLKQIVTETLNFETPVKKVHDGISVLELFHGPTLAFKDVGARFMARCLGHFLEESEKSTTVLVATSGDTGGAVANGFYKVPGIKVVILYPKGKVSPLQEKQLTALGENITAFEVEGNFDDCQSIVKQAFLDDSIKEKYGLTSANSINVARWLPQMFYYLNALQQIEKETVFCVPSGNFGNICAGMMAQNLGFDVKHFIAATNVNDVVPRYLESKEYTPKPTTATISNAMDVSDPSNFIRIQNLYENFENLEVNLSSYRFTDEATKETMKEVYTKHNYLLDPHGAVGYLGVQKYLEDNQKANDQTEFVFLETAHPVKFVEVVEEALAIDVDMPTELSTLMKQEKQSFLCEPNYESFKELLQKHI